MAPTSTSPIPPSDRLVIRGARTHNLKGIDVDLPKNQMIVVTGVSGSGKSSLAFDTLFAEGQRRYVESLSTYARQFLDRMEKPDVERIDGLTPAIAIEQRGTTPNPRSTISTITEIHDHLRVLYAAIGIPHDPKTGQPLEKLTPGEIVDRLMQEPERSRVILLVPVDLSAEPLPSDMSPKEQASARIDGLCRQGFVRARINGSLVELDAEEAAKIERIDSLEIVIDRLVIRDGVQSRFTDSVETACARAKHRISALVMGPDDEDYREVLFPLSFTNPETGFSLTELSPRHFSFNSPQGACSKCHGVGTVPQPSPELLIPDRRLSLAEGAVKCWWRDKAPKSVALWKKQLAAVAAHHSVPDDLALTDAPAEFFDTLMNGTSQEIKGIDVPFDGLLAQARRLRDGAKSEAVRRRFEKFFARSECPSCHGARLRPHLLAVKLKGADAMLGINDWCAQSVDAAHGWMESMPVTGRQALAVQPIVDELRNRLGFLREVGLGYLTLDRQTSTLSGGEYQRVRLATQLGSRLSGVTYVLDEPSIGLHPADNARLIQAIHRLRDLGNTIVVVEHDSETILAADYLVEIGPGAGHHGGELLAYGPIAELVKSRPDSSTTLPYLVGAKHVGAKMTQRAVRSDDEEVNWLELRGCSGQNLQDIDLRIPIGRITGVAGASGSGKSTLINHTLKPLLTRLLNRSRETGLAYKSIHGEAAFERCISIDQSPIGSSPRSNPATFAGAFDEIRKVFTKLPESRMRGYSAARFSFNRPGGRCEVCQGNGALKIDMHFLPDTFVPCEACNGKRYNRETLEIQFKGKSIADVLEMTVDDAARFFGKISKVTRTLESMRQVGLGYLVLGQPGNTLSGGEAQRLKLATELARKSHGRTIYLLDEPTTGLHFSDIDRLLDQLGRLRDAGNTVVVIEHHPDVLKSTDWIVELGPGGGVHGGRVVAQGTPAEVAKAPESPTAPYLRTPTS